MNLSGSGPGTLLGLFRTLTLNRRGLLVVFGESGLPVSGHGVTPDS